MPPNAVEVDPLEEAEPEFWDFVDAMVAVPDERDVGLDPGARRFMASLSEPEREIYERLVVG